MHFMQEEVAVADGNLYLGVALFLTLPVHKPVATDMMTMIQITDRTFQIKPMHCNYLQETPSPRWHGDP